MNTFVHYAEPTEIADGLCVAAGTYTDADIQTERVSVYIGGNAAFLTAEQTAELIAALAQSLAVLLDDDDDETAGGEA